MRDKPLVSSPGNSDALRELWLRESSREDAYRLGERRGSVSHTQRMNFHLTAQIVKNTKSKCRWLILTFLAIWWLASTPVRAEEDQTYGRAALIEIAPTPDFLPTVALLDDGELECPSADAFTIIQSYAPGMSGIVSTDKIMTAERMRIEAALDCRTTDREQVVLVLMIYNLLLSGHPVDKRTIAKVRLTSGAEHYVEAGALQF